MTNLTHVGQYVSESKGFVTSLEHGKICIVQKGLVVVSATAAIQSFKDGAWAFVGVRGAMKSRVFR